MKTPFHLIGAMPLLLSGWLLAAANSAIAAPLLNPAVPLPRAQNGADPQEESARQGREDEQQSEQQSEQDDWGDDSWSDDNAGSGRSARWQWGGFTELALGSRLDSDALIADDSTLQEVRQRLEASYPGQEWQLSLKADLTADGVTEALQVDFRQAELALSPSDNWDLKLGRQVLTWGTGQYLFVNDLFPKDWQSFFAGRDDEYLKAPTTALKASYFGSRASLDLVWMPDFRSDRFINGERFSFFDTRNALQLAPSPPLGAEEPTSSIDGGELAARLFNTRGALEYALYGYRGFWKTPRGICASGNPCYPRLNVWGASVRGPLGAGLGNVEMAWFDSREDSDGDDPDIPNDQIRLLLGYEQEVMPRLTAAGQYYLEWTRDYDALQQNQPADFLPEQYRQLLSLDLRYRSPQDKLNLGLFMFWSPSDRDYYLRPSASYRIDDAWQLSGGMNLLGGDRPHTQFSQMADGSNAWLRLRYRF